MRRYLVGRQVEGVDTWEIVSCLEMVVSGNNWQINYGSGIPAVTLTEQDVVIRIWLPSPGAPDRGRLPVPRAAADPVRDRVAHPARVRPDHLAAGGQRHPADAPGDDLPPPPETQNPDGTTTPASPANDADAFMASLADAMMAPIEDPSSPSAIVPIVVTAPDDVIDKPRLLTFWSELDAASMGLRNEAIRRFALGMDLPPEQVLGMSGTSTGASSGTVSHWGAWQVEESTIKLHIEPMLDVIVNALTVGYLRPC